MKGFTLHERPQYFAIAYGTLTVVRIPKRSADLNRLNGLSTDDKKRANLICKAMNEKKMLEAIIGK